MTLIQTDYIKATPQEVVQFIRDYFAEPSTTTIYVREPRLEGDTPIFIQLRDRRENFSVWWANVILYPEGDGMMMLSKALDVESIQLSFKDDQFERERSIHGYGENLNKLYRKILERFGQPENNRSAAMDEFEQIIVNKLSSERDRQIAREYKSGSWHDVAELLGGQRSYHTAYRHIRRIRELCGKDSNGQWVVSFHKNNQRKRKGKNKVAI